MAGGLVMAAARRRGVAVLPVDSEHNAIHQCLHGRPPGEVRRLLLTASGGRSAAGARSASRACGRPTPWPIRPGAGPQDHRRLGDVDEQGPRGHRGPLALRDAGRSDRRGRASAVGGALARRALRRVGDSPRWGSPTCACPSSTRSLTLTGGTAGCLRSISPPAACLEFSPPDLDRFPCLALAYRALRGGPALPVALNAANEVAVEAFLDERLAFTAIPDVIAGALDDAEAGPADPMTLADVRRAHARATRYSRRRITELQSER